MPFEVALTGLNAASADLQILANNIANSSTAGFKESRGEFSDIFAVSNLGGTSTSIGSGVRLTKVAQQFTQGNITFTENNLDLGINGSGFFRLNDSGSVVYARSGAFSVDRQGYVVNPSGQRLTTFESDSNGNITGALADLQLDTNSIAPIATQGVTLDANIDAAETAIAVNFNSSDPTTFNHSTSTTIFDSLGTSHLTTMYFQKSTNNTWNVFMELDGAEVVPTNGTGGNTPPDAWEVTFDPSTGRISTVLDPSGAAPATANNLTYQAINPTGGAAALPLEANIEDLTQFGADFSVNSLTQDGTPTGRLSGIDIDESGIVFARFTNGQSQTLGQVALTSFSNPQGLRQLGDSTWAETFDSGSAITGAPGTSSLGLVQSGALEESNVDLSSQLVNLITAQRNFQANAQVINSADTITQTILNIGR